VKLRIYSLGWGCTVQTDKIHLWRLVKRVLISQLYERCVTLSFSIGYCLIRYPNIYKLFCSSSINSSNVHENKDRKKKRIKRYGDNTGIEILLIYFYMYFHETIILKFKC
jgi:hypothetical protein